MGINQGINEIKKEINKKIEEINWEYLFNLMNNVTSDLSNKYLMNGEKMYLNEFKILYKITNSIMDILLDVQKSYFVKENIIKQLKIELDKFEKKMKSKNK